MQIIEDAKTTEKIAKSVNSTKVYIVPAGLGAPHWNMEAKGLICGLTRNK